MRRATFADMHCSMARALDVIGDTWTPLILRDLFLGLSRFDDLVTDLGISRNLLTARLDHLMAAGVVSRHAYQDRPERYEYRLTDSGQDLIPVLVALTRWGDQWATPGSDGPPILFRHSCGARFEPVVTCPECGEGATADSISPEAGPGGRRAPGTQLVAQLLAASADDQHSATPVDSADAHVSRRPVD